ncbi:MAG: phosphatase PAP2 family protein [Flavobacteriales bacterium]|nr:phosphatase PAP2 family protein [Flavobacteriales bacterium]
MACKQSFRGSLFSWPDYYPVCASGSPALLLWAGIICYSRIYLGVHFPADVVVGALYGGIIGFGCAFSYKRLMVNFNKSGK